METTASSRNAGGSRCWNWVPPGLITPAAALLSVFLGSDVPTPSRMRGSGFARDATLRG